MFKKLTCLLTATLLALNISACGSNKTATTATASVYEEKEISSNTGLKAPGSFKINSQNQLVVYDRNTDSPKYAILDSDGKPVGEIKCDFTGDGSVFTLDAQDNLYALVQNNVSDTEISRQLYVYNSKGEKTNTIDLGKVPAPQGLMTFSGKAPDGATGQKVERKMKLAPQGAKSGDKGQMKMMGMMSGVIDMGVDSKGNIYLAKLEQGIEVLDSNGKPVKTINAQGCNSIDIDGEDNLIIGGFNMGGGKTYIAKLNTSSGENVWKKDLDSTGGVITIGGASKIKYNKADKCIYVMNEKGVKKYDSSGKLVGTVLDFKAYTILASGSQVTGMSLDQSGNLYFIAMSRPNPDSPQPTSEKNFELYKYTPQLNAQKAKDEKVLTLSVSQSDRFLEMAVSKFQKDNPGIKVDVKEYPSEKGSDDYEKYVKTLNTQMLTGKGPDIISVSGLPYKKYIDKNALASLSEMISNDKEFDISKYTSNIVDALKYKGSLYTLPISYSFEVLAANKSILDKEGVSIDDTKWTWKDFQSIAEKVTKDSNNDGTPDQYALPNMSYSKMLGYILRSSYSKFIDMEKKQANFTSQEFIDALNFIKSLVDKKLLNTNIEADIESAQEKMPDLAARGVTALSPHEMRDYLGYHVTKMTFGGQSSLLNFPSDGDLKGGMFSSDKMFAINRNSKYKPEAWKFLKFLLSDDMQSQMEMMGFSINKEAQKKKGKNTVDMMAKGGIKIMIKGAPSSDVKPLSQQDIDYVDKLTEGLTVYADDDEQVTRIIQEEVKPFFSGDKSAEDVAKLIQNRVSTYLRE